MPSILGNLAGIAILAGSTFLAARWLNTGRPPARLSTAVEWVTARVRRRRPAPEPLPPVLLSLELRRMTEAYRRVDEGDQPAKAERLAVCRLAYDQVLRDYCRRVDIEVPPGHGGLSPEQRLALETALISAGYDW